MQHKADESSKAKVQNELLNPSNVTYKWKVSNITLAFRDFTHLCNSCIVWQRRDEKHYLLSITVDSLNWRTRVYIERWGEPKTEHTPSKRNTLCLTYHHLSLSSDISSKNHIHSPHQHGTKIQSNPTFKNTQKKFVKRISEARQENPEQAPLTWYMKMDNLFFYPRPWPLQKPTTKNAPKQSRKKGNSWKNKTGRKTHQILTSSRASRHAAARASDQAPGDQASHRLHGWLPMNPDQKKRRKRKREGGYRAEELWFGNKARRVTEIDEAKGFDRWGVTVFTRSPGECVFVSRRRRMWTPLGEMKF